MYVRHQASRGRTLWCAAVDDIDRVLDGIALLLSVWLNLATYHNNCIDDLVLEFLADDFLSEAVQSSEAIVVKRS